MLLLHEFRKITSTCWTLESNVLSRHTRQSELSLFSISIPTKINEC